MVVARGSGRGSLISTEVFVFVRVLEVAVVMAAQCMTVLNTTHRTLKNG